MTFDHLCTLRVAIWGLGAEGVDVARLLAARGVVPVLIDDLPVDAALSSGGLGEVLAPDRVPWATLDVVVRSPGVSRYRPELAQAEAAGVAVTTAMAVWLEDFADARVIAVTGTKGKSTTAALTASLLRHDGLEVALIGNIGVPVTGTYGRPPVDAYVVEVSSYQAADVTVTPGVCVLTALAPDHLDWHGGEERYYRDKLRLVEAGPPGSLAVNAANDEAVRRTAGHPDRMLFGPTGRVRWTDADVIEVDGVPLAEAGRMRLPGRHNRWNLCGAVAGSLLLNGRPPSPEALAATIAAVDTLPSRCRTIGEHEGITFVDDALASNPFATVASLASFPGRALTLILGGADRGIDPRGLVEAVAARHPAPRVIVLPPEPHRLADALVAFSRSAGRPLTVEMADDLGDAVGRALQMTPDGGVVLFSPAAPTPAGSGGYADRSRQFAEAAGLSGNTPA